MIWRVILLLVLCTLCVCPSLEQPETEGNNPSDHTNFVLVEVSPFNITTLEELCKLFHIPPKNCTCSIFKVKDPFIESLCDIDQPVIHYSHIFSKVYASLAILFSIVGVAGNSLVVIVSAFAKEDLTTCQKLVTCLAVCDLISAGVLLLKAVRNLWTNT